jgi:hypothetical protein
VLDLDVDIGAMSIPTKLSDILSCNYYFLEEKKMNNKTKKNPTTEKIT